MFPASENLGLYEQRRSSALSTAKCTIGPSQIGATKPRSAPAGTPWKPRKGRCGCKGRALAASSRSRTGRSRFPEFAAPLARGHSDPEAMRKHTPLESGLKNGRRHAFCLAHESGQGSNQNPGCRNCHIRGCAASVAWLTAALDLLVARLFGSGGRDGGNQSDLMGVAGGLLDRNDPPLLNSNGISKSESM